jgi:hypothetical protein
MRVRLSGFLLGWLLLVGCKEAKESNSQLFSKGVALGTVADRLHEASGLVESIANPSHLWTLNDSGNPAEIFLIDQKAEIKLVCKLKDVHNRDFEEIAIGAGPDSTKNYIYAGDIGDNLSRYRIKLIYRFEEPVIGKEKEILIYEFDTLQIILSDGNHDTEAMMIDPRSHHLYLVSKRQDSVNVYNTPYPFQKNVMTAKIVATIPFQQIVAGSFSTDGKEVLLKDIDNVYYWNNESMLPLSELLMRPPEILPYEPEKQGESIAWARDGSGYYTLSEEVNGKLGDLLFYKRKQIKPASP